MITVTKIFDDNGVLWENCCKLTTALVNVPENGHFHWGSREMGNMYDKYAQLEAMRNAGVRTPEFTNDLKVAQRWVKQGETVFGRFKNHSKGSDITVNKVIHTTRTFWTKYVPSREEWRIHIFDGLSIARWLKLYPPLLLPITEKAIHERATQYNATSRVEPPAGLRDFAKSMITACVPLTYGACDILIGKDGKFYALEVNTAPELDEYTLQAYVKAVRRRFAR